MSDNGSAHSSVRRRSSAVWWAGAAVALALLWYGVFHMVGNMWWNAAQPEIERVPPPEPLRVERANTDWVDLDKYSRENPVWEPARE